MNADCAFRMGKTHTVCQDYAIAEGGVTPRALLADGCSSSPDSDIGARLLVRTVAMQAWDRSVCAEGEERRLLEAVSQARQQAALLGLEDRALDATLLEIRAEAHHWHAEIYGDGVLAWEDSDGLLHALSLTYRGGYPRYPNYLADTAREAAFFALEDNDRQREEVVFTPEGETLSLDIAVDSVCAPSYRHRGELAQTRWAAALSDGIHSFVETRNVDGRAMTEPVHWHKAAFELLAFKSLNGLFVQRRLQRFLQSCELRRWQFRDDISVAAVAMGKRG